MHLSPLCGVILFKFRRELWCQKTRVHALSCGIIFVTLRLAFLIQYRSVTDGQTHDEGIYRQGRFVVRRLGLAIDQPVQQICSLDSLTSKI